MSICGASGINARKEVQVTDPDELLGQLQKGSPSLQRIRMWYLQDHAIFSPVQKGTNATPSSTKSESYIDQMMVNHPKEKRRSNSVSFSEIQTIEVLEWQESNPPPQLQPTRRTSNSSHSVSFSDQPISPGSTKSSQNSTGCSSQQQQNVIALTQALVTLQQERNAAVKRAPNASNGVSIRDKNSILAELKARYEHKVKRLIQEISDLRRKYNEATQSNTKSKNQNETMLKSTRDNYYLDLSGTQGEMVAVYSDCKPIGDILNRKQDNQYIFNNKIRKLIEMIMGKGITFKHLSSKDNQFADWLKGNELKRKIIDLLEQQNNNVEGIIEDLKESKRKIKKMKKIIVENEEYNSDKKNMMEEEGRIKLKMSDSKIKVRHYNKCYDRTENMRMMKRTKDETERVREITGRSQRELQIFVIRKKLLQEQKKRLERTSEMQKIMLEKRQKEVLQIKYGRQTLAMMDEWIVKRNNLQEEKNKLLEEREKIITSKLEMS
ncbi:kinesin family member 4/21/27 [Rhizophagus clarus]|uniref:Kinesin family member 4/21/27 n=1 Tax=Rhizophagus clarus TaxID=94130 RepID=A0A8H3QLQ7_9GLOM|nr:kinesin family member 4/21/27 [Rhizophagus clarus]